MNQTFLAALLILGGLAILSCSKQDETGASKSKTPKVVDPAVAKAKAEKRAYALCLPCHNGDGRGTPTGRGRRMAPALVGSELALGEPLPAIAIVLKGIEKEGLDYDGVMAPLSVRDEMLANALNYVRSQWGNDAPPITTEEVKAAKARLAPVRKPWKRSELPLLVIDPEAAIKANTDR